MNRYMGVKQVNAMPMTREEYNELRGWTVPADENPDDAGYLIEYVDSGKANTEDFKWHVSWSPADVFDRSYRAIGAGMTFGMALEVLKSGGRVARIGWNGKAMWLKLVPTDLADKVAFEFAALSAYPWIGMKTADDKFVPWLASQTDVLAEDWCVIP